MVTKEDVFKNIVLCIRDWYEADTGNLEKNDLSILKVFKLLFFIVADSPKLISYFDFHCVPYGHLDKELLERVKENTNFGFFKMNNFSTEFKGEPDFAINISINNEIVNRISQIKKLNPDFIKAPAFDLVELNQQWYSFTKHYYPAKKKEIYSVPCPKEDILQDNKSYYTGDYYITMPKWVYLKNLAKWA